MHIRLTRNLFIILLFDITLLMISIFVAHLFKFDFKIPKWAFDSLFEFLPYVLFIKILCFFLFDLYKGMWRYTGLNDLISVVKAATASSVCIIVLILYLNRFEQVSRSVFVIDWSITIILIMGLRIITRLCFESFTEKVKLRDIFGVIISMFYTKKIAPGGKRVLVLGAGDCAEKVCREFRENANVKSQIIGFLDDDIAKTGRKIHGISVLGQIKDLKQFVDSHNVEEIIIAIPSVSAVEMRTFVNACKDLDLSFKTVPDMGELIDGKISINSIRKVEYRDLLGREPVELDKIEIGKYLTNKTVLVTGAAGSIGSGLCKQICQYSPSKLILFERAESPLYDIDLELSKKFQDIKILPVLGDIQSKEEIEKLFNIEKPEIVFHAAAYKHVPMLEKYPWKAVENNIFGTQNIVEIADKYECEKFVFVSTDKAVNPCNIMGASKRVCELIVQNFNLNKKSETKFLIVRFGNVIGSVGSVIPLFKKQIKDGGPVTITHPDIIRYFMLIPEACQLILQAGSMGNGGEIFILEMGEPVKIDTMARDLIKFSGYKPDIDIKIEYTGLRPGEKLFEELITNQENVVPTNHKKIMVLNGKEVNINTLKYNLKNLQDASKKRNIEAIKQKFNEIVPEYVPFTRLS